MALRGGHLFLPWVAISFQIFFLVSSRLEECSTGVGISSRFILESSEKIDIITSIWVAITIVRGGAETDGRRDACARAATFFPTNCVRSTFVEK